jgi:hypothetical protein
MKPVYSFERAKRELDQKGRQAYSMHKRISIPKSKIPQESLRELGFRKSYLAVPEPGQKRWVSYRHPDRYHIHDHGEHWVMHRDSHDPTAINLKTQIKHQFHEALPSTKHFLEWKKNKKGPILDTLIDAVDWNDDGHSKSAYHISPYPANASSDRHEGYHGREYGHHSERHSGQKSDKLTSGKKKQRGVEKLAFSPVRSQKPSGSIGGATGTPGHQGRFSPPQVKPQLPVQPQVPPQVRTQASMQAPPQPQVQVQPQSQSQQVQPELLEKIKRMMDGRLAAGNAL